jgi:hypothetical protein
MPTTTYSEEEYLKVARLNDGMLWSLYHASERAARRAIPKREDASAWRAKGCFELIPKNPRDLVRIFDALRQQDVIKDMRTHGSYFFCDAGSGIGIPSLLFKTFFQRFRTEGIELNSELAKMDIGNEVVHNADILTFDTYGKYDVIYYYSPLIDDAKEREFEARVEDRCKVGCVLVCCRKRNPEAFKDARFKQVQHDVFKGVGCSVFVKVSDKKRLKKLSAQKEREVRYITNDG